MIKICCKVNCYSIIEKTNFRICWHNRETLPNKNYLKISFVVSENMPTFALRWSGSLREVPSVAPAYHHRWYAFMRGVYHESGASRSLFCHSLSLVVYVLCFYFGIRFAHIVGICAYATILVQLLH